jgi:hypothetical protein
VRPAAPLAALVLTGLLWLPAGAPAQADEPGPFPSPSPSIAPAGGNGYVAVGFSAANASGGQIVPRPGSTDTPRPFVNAGAGGFSLDLVGRISDTFLAALKYDDYAVHGDDNPFVSYSQGILLYNPHQSIFAVGLGYLSAQRSTASVSANGAGLGATLLPRFRSGASVYGSAFFYPQMHSNGTTTSVSALEAGVVFTPPRRGGLFYRVGGFVKTGASHVSPTQISGLTAGVGASF